MSHRHLHLKRILPFQLGISASLSASVSSGSIFLAYFPHPVPSTSVMGTKKSHPGAGGGRGQLPSHPCRVSRAGEGQKYRHRATQVGTSCRSPEAQERFQLDKCYPKCAWASQPPWDATTHAHSQHTHLCTHHTHTPCTHRIPVPSA
jgi:hypothetical protein